MTPATGTTIRLVPPVDPLATVLAIGRGEPVTVEERSAALEALLAIGRERRAAEAKSKQAHT